MASKANWAKMSLEQRIKAANIDIMRNPDFALLAGVVCMGDVVIDDRPTAATDGLDVFYGREFMEPQPMECVRWINLHENFHKGLKHCSIYADLMEKYDVVANQAMDYVINGMIYELDPAESFARRPLNVNVCFNEKYFGWSIIEVLRDLLKNPPPKSGGGFDEHLPRKMTPEQTKQLQQKVDEALAHGKILAGRLAGKGRGNSVLDRAMQDRYTDWRTPFRRFFEEVVNGDDYSRYCPPNRRMLPLGFIMPSHFSESTGEVILAADTSGSMHPHYPVLFGEVSRICKTVRPSLLRLIWWDDGIQSEQVFGEKDYDSIATAMAPTGGGGTTPQCVVEYIAEKGYKPKALVWLTDGWLSADGTSTSCPQMWGVIDNRSFVPPQGRVLHIDSFSIDK